jgi:hypothetical protein
MSKKLYLIFNTILILIGILLVLELLRDSRSAGDFEGYVHVGKLVLAKENIYSYYLNTWPPFFSVFSVVLALGDNMSSYLIRFLWLSGSIMAMYYIIVLTIKMVFNKTVSLKANADGVMFQDPIVMVPILIMIRFLLDNLANVQINIYILLCTFMAVKFFISERYIWVGLFLGFIISLKVYPIFFLFYFLFKREYKPVAWTLLFIGIFNAIPFLVFGVDQSAGYYQYWSTVVASSSSIPHHKNQSLFGMFLRLFTADDIGIDMHVNILRSKAETVKLLTYLVVATATIIPAYIFRKKLINKQGIHSIFEYSFILTAIPLLSPLSWKAYFIFLWLPYFLIYLTLFRTTSTLSSTRLIKLKSLFGLSIILNVFSSDLFLGFHYSKIMEAYSCITIGTMILLVIQLVIVVNIKRFDLGSVLLSSKPDAKSI